MSRETASRDLSLNALAVLTGGLTAAALVGTGLVTGLAADYTAQKAQAKALSNAAAAPLPADVAPAPVATPRPVRTVVTTRYVQGKARLVSRQTITRTSGSVSTVRSYRQPAPAPQRAPARAVAPAPSAAS
ncbi:MAG TPA: hypothetical protein VFF32_15255 [Dermatophilaceae bacterium]|nr:hypothetical protein [Dermatophilaceae bacterium]